MLAKDGAASYVRVSIPAQTENPLSSIEVRLVVHGDQLLPCWTELLSFSNHGSFQSRRKLSFDSTKPDHSVDRCASM